MLVWTSKPYRKPKRLKSWQLTLQLRKEGANRFFELSTDYSHRSGNPLPLAFVLDGRILTAPVFVEPIAGGTAQITGSYTQEEARTLATVVMNPLPFRLEIVSEEVLPPG